MKKLLKVLLCLILFFSLMPKEEAKAETGTITNIQINGDVISWDPYPGADGYVILFDNEHGYWADGTSENLQRCGNNIDLPAGEYSIEIRAWDEDGNTIASGIAPGIYRFAGKQYVSNVKIDASGIMTWDPFPGAVEYAIVYTEDWSGYFFTDTNSADLPLELGRKSASSGTYSILIQALDENWMVIGDSGTRVPYTYTSKGKIPTPTGIRWTEGNHAMWDTITIPETSLLDYEILVYRNGELWKSFVSWGQPGYELDEYLVGENNQYSFSVIAMYEGYEASDESVRSSIVTGRPSEYKRLSGSSRYVTSRMVADQVLMKMQSRGSEKLYSVVITTGENYPDALSGSFLANRFSAPMLMINQKNAQAVVEYVKNNVMQGGRIYVLGGDGAVPNEWLGDLATSGNYQFKRLYGSNRYKTNLEILKEANVSGGAFIVCTGGNYADSLSCSSLYYPMLLVGKSLNADQRAFLNSLDNEYTGFYIIGGTGAVSEEIEAELANYGWTNRISGKNRYETSAKIAECFKYDSTNVVLATGKNFPDGLSGGPLASIYNAPLILVDDGKTSYAEEFTARNGIGTGYVLGGTGAVSDDTMNKVFHIGQ